MWDWSGFLTRLRPLVPFLVTAVAVFAGLRAAIWLLLRRRTELRKEQKFARQLLILVLALGGVFVLLFALPVERDDRDQLIGLAGLVVTALIAYSSSSVAGDIAAGLTLRVSRPFGIGDHIRIGDFTGRVVEMGLLDVEMQSTDRELISLPNRFVLTTPIIKTRPSGAVISAAVSLSYGTHNRVVEPLLREAASSSGLEDVFVTILDLGDFTVTYRIAGLLTEADSLITARSSLRRAVLETLHDHDIEIMSPHFAREQAWPPQERMIPAPPRTPTPPESETVRAEDVVFDKATRAGELEREKQRLSAGLEDLDKRLSGTSGDQRKQIEAQIEQDRAHLTAIEEQQRSLAAEDEKT